MARVFVRLVLFLPFCLPLFGSLLYLLGGRGLFIAIPLVFVACLCLIFLPESVLALRRYEADSLTVCGQVLLGIAVIFLTVASLGVGNVTDFSAKVGSLPLFILTLRGSVFWTGSAGALYGIMLTVIPGPSRRWAQSMSLSLAAMACLFAIHDLAPYLEGTDPIEAINTRPWESLSWIGLYLLLLYKMNKRRVLPRATG